MRACEQVQIEGITSICGRTATVCEYDGQAILKMYHNGRFVNQHKFPLWLWDMALEFGAGYLATGGKPAKDSF